MEVADEDIPIPTTTFDRGRANVLPVAWHTPLSAQPPLVGVAIELNARDERDPLARVRDDAEPAPWELAVRRFECVDAIHVR